MKHIKRAPQEAYTQAPRICHDLAASVTELTGLWSWILASVSISRRRPQAHRVWLSAVAGILVFAVMVARVEAGAGNLDVTFDFDGRATPVVGGAELTAPTTAADVAVQRDGKILVVGVGDGARQEGKPT